MLSIGFYCDEDRIERNAWDQLQQYAQAPYIQALCAFPDIHYCSEKALPVGVAFETKDYAYPLITGKDIGCGVMYLRISKESWTKPFNKAAHYPALVHAHQKMTDDGLGGGNHFLSLEEDESSVYIICHTGTRNRGIALYQECVQLTREFSRANGRQADYVHRDFLSEKFLSMYEQVVQFGHVRRKSFCVKTLLFLQQANYIPSPKGRKSLDYRNYPVKDLPLEGTLNGTIYKMEDSMHNHLEFEKDRIMHRKGSTGLGKGKTAVIPLSMSRGSLLVQPGSLAGTEAALFSCSHGAGRKLSRFEAVKHWKTVLKEKERKEYKERFPEMLDRNGSFPSGYIQELDFAYKDSREILRYQPYLKLVTRTKPIVTVKYTEI